MQGRRCFKEVIKLDSYECRGKSTKRQIDSLKDNMARTGLNANTTRDECRLRSFYAYHSFDRIIQDKGMQEDVNKLIKGIRTIRVTTGTKH